MNTYPSPAPEPTPPRPAPRRRRAVLTAVILVAVAGGVLWWVHAHTKAETKFSRHDISAPVALATIGKGDIQVTDPALGTVTPLANVTVRTQIAGQLLEVAFTEGQIVHKGDFLAQVDPRPYQTVLEQAQGALTRDRALLRDAQLNLARYRTLEKQDSIARQQADTQASLVQQYQGDTVTDQGQIDAAKLNIDYCHIVAPVTGRVGLRQVDAGNYVQTSDTNGVVVLTQLDPISVVFTLPEDELAAVVKQFGTGTALQVTALDRTENKALATGTLSAIDNQIDVTTGTVRMRAIFDNPSYALFPNQFVNVSLLVDTLHDVVLAPSAAIQRGAPGTFVYLAKDDGTVAVRVVKLGVAQGDKVQVLDGLNEGDKVVTDGTDKLSDGAKYKLPGQGGDQKDGKGGDQKGSSDKSDDGKPDGQKPGGHRHHGGNGGGSSSQ